MGSSRLPGKMLMEMRNKKTLLENVINRCQLCEMVDKVVILTSTEPNDTDIVNFCFKNQIEVFRGSLDNVYERFVQCIDHHKVDAFVRICGDSPFMSYRLIDYCINLFQSHSADLVSNIYVKTFPSGQSVEVVSADYFCSEEHYFSKIFSQEHVTKGLYGLRGKTISVETTCSLNIPKLSIDTKKDFQKINDLYEKYDQEYFEPSFENISCRQVLF